MSKHTPGPWRIVQNSNMNNLIEAYSGRKYEDGSDRYKTVATFHACCASNRYDDEKENALANARLIAAAPELLDALQAIADTDWIDAGIDQQRAVRIARAAIAKAKGEPT